MERKVGYKSLDVKHVQTYCRSILYFNIINIT